MVQFHHITQFKRPIDNGQVLRRNLQVIKQETANTGWHGGIDSQVHHRTKTLFTQSLLNTFQQVRRFIFSNLNIGVAQHAKRIRLPDIETWEEHTEVGRDQLLQPDKGKRSRHLFVQGNTHQAR